MTTILDRPLTSTTPARDDGNTASADAAITLVADDEDRARRIRAAVRTRSKELRQRHPLLRHQSAIGATILGVAAVGAVASGALFVTGRAPWWITVPLAAFFMSLAHEIEHDTIHRLYFSRNKAAERVMFAVCWLLRPYTISPWARRPLHLLHHKVSGTEQDIEERAITNGEPWNVRRAVMMIDPLASVLLRLPDDPAVRNLYLKAVARFFFPLTYVALAVWYGFLGITLVNVAGTISGHGPLVTGSVADAIKLLTVVWIAPNVLRVLCLHFISSNMHYIGDVEAGNVVQQTQVLNRWFLLPLQLFCANFGSTHGIHHFVPGEPFYVRQLTAGVAHDAMRANGVRFNDFGTFRRRNRWGRAAT